MKKVVVDIWMIADLFYEENDEEWIEALKSIIKKLNELSDTMIMPHIRKYLKDFVNVAIRAIKGKCSKKELVREKDRILKLLEIAYSS